MDWLQYCPCSRAKMRPFVIFLAAIYFHSVVADDEPESYSYHKFTGPVSGQIKEVYVQDGSNRQAVDYIAKPDYTYSYGIEDPFTGNSQKHEETRQGDNVQGEYTVVQPDGLLRIVRYIADPEKGFQVDVQYKPINAPRVQDSNNNHEDDDE